MTPIGLLQVEIEHPWNSCRVILPLVLGFVGWGCFHFQQLFTK
jgi:hypothetical protein